MKNTKAAKVLKFLSDHPTGLKFGEIQRFVVEQIAGLNYDDKQPERVWDYKTCACVIRQRRIHRGYWCDYLPKLLFMYANKDQSKRYTINKAGRTYVETGHTKAQQIQQRDNL